MSRRCRVGLGIVCAVGVAAVLGVHAPAQQRELTAGQTKLDRLFTVDLSEVGLQGDSAAQRVTVEPGIKTADHTHSGRTSIIVVTQGAYTDVRGTSKTEYKAGDVVRVAEGTTHHAENYGTVPVVYVEINTTAKKAQ